MLAPLSNMKSVAFAMMDFGLAENRTARLPRLVAGVGASSFGRDLEVAELSLDEMDGARGEWADLAARALEPNGFYEPGFALSAALHFPLKARPRFIVVWGHTAAGERRMKGFFPIVSARPLVGDNFIRLWLHKQAALATPLVDRDAPEAVLETFLDWLEARSLSAGIVFSKMTAGGRFQETLENVARRRRRRAQILHSYERAALLPGATADEICARAGSKKKLAELHRIRRRLAEMGRVDFEVVDSPEDVRRASEEFLALEGSGWKAGRGAFLSHPSLTTFLRSATRLLAREGRCRIHALRLDGRPLAMAILIESQGRSNCWKIAYDESFRSQAPGVQLIYEQTKSQLARPEIEITDSCAIANHPMIDRMWPDRIGVCDLAVQLQSGGEGDFLASCRKDASRRNLRDLAKRAANRLLKRKAN